ncbi:hypothetical protein D3C85_1244820 [compost metagenome]
MRTLAQRNTQIQHHARIPFASRQIELARCGDAISQAPVAVVVAKLKLRAGPCATPVILRRARQVERSIPRRQALVQRELQSAARRAVQLEFAVQVLQTHGVSQAEVMTGRVAISGHRDIGIGWGYHLTE